jgi:hypothetical protein
MTMTVAVITVALLMLPAVARAEWTVKPFAGLTFGGSHGFVDLDGTSGRSKPIFGGAVGWRGSSIGVELEVASDPKRLKGSSDLVVTGRAMSVMVNATWTMPRRLGPIRTYLTGGIGSVRVAYEDSLDAFTATTTLAAANVGGGVLIPATPRIEFVADIRYLRTSYGDSSPGGFGEPYLAYWRAIAGLLFRF